MRQAPISVEALRSSGCVCVCVEIVSPRVVVACLVLCAAPYSTCPGHQHTPGHGAFIFSSSRSPTTYARTAAEAHVADADIAAVNCPGTLSLIGRAEGRENHAVVGEYDLAGVHHGRPAYRQRCGDAVLRYHAPEGRWLLAAAGAAGNVCSAFADGSAAAHPACGELAWHFWEVRRSAFVADPAVRTAFGRAIRKRVRRAAGATREPLQKEPLESRTQGSGQDSPLHVASIISAAFSRWHV